MQSRRAKRHLAVLVASAAGLMIAPSATLAQDKTFDLKLSHWVPPTHPLQKAMEEGAHRSRRHRTAPSSSRFSVPAARQGIRPLRHGARRHRRLHLRQSRLSARPLPDHLGRRIAVPGRQRQGRHPGDRHLVSQARRDRDEGREILLLLHSRSADVAFEQEEDCRARRHQGNRCGRRRRPSPPGSCSSAAPTCRQARRKSAK